MPRSQKKVRNKRKRSPSPSSSSTSSTSSSSSSESDGKSRRRRRRNSRTVSQNAIVSSVIPEFDPLIDNVDMWLNVVDANARAFGWSEKMTKFQALQKLRNTAQTWYNSLQKTETEWTTWKWRQWRDRLSSTFKIKRNAFVLLKDLINSKPAEGQSLYEFFFQQKCRVNKLALAFNEQDIISIIVGSIDDKSLSVAAESGSFRNCDELASYLHGKVYEGEKDKKSNVSSSSRNLTVPPAKKYNQPQQPISQGVESKIESQNSNDFNKLNLRCYRCGEIGHKKINCSLKGPISCNYCKKNNHVESVCLSKSKMKIEKEVEVKLINSHNSKERFFKNIFLNGFECQAFVDMGSDCSLILSTMIDQLALKPYQLEVPLPIVGFTKDVTIVLDSAVDVSVVIDGVELPITLYVIENLSGCKVLIGRNFTEDSRIMYSRVGEVLTFQMASNSSKVMNVCNVNLENNSHESVINKILLKYPKCFSTDLSNLGKVSGIEVEIELTTMKPVFQRPYRMSESERAKTREIVDDLLKNGIIRCSNSSYASPALLVDKASGEKRLCIDYRRLNKITVKEKYPMPLIEDLIDRLRGCKYFTALDLKCGYHHLIIKESDVHKSAFITLDGHYEWLRLPFGLCNGPAVFQRVMNAVLGNLRFGKVINFMDDLLIATETLEENVSCLENVLELLQSHGLTINLKKCSFFKENVQFLGYEIAQDGIRPSTHKVEAVSSFPTPKSIHEVRQFLGLINYFRKFIPNCAVLARPLNNLLKKDSMWKWESVHDRSFSQLKSILVSNRVLSIFDPKLPINLYTDASRDGLGCILTQITDTGERPVYFYSRQTSNEEKNYHSFELELLAVVTGLRKFRHYLLGTTFKIFTDCSAVRYALTKQDIIPRISRWVLQTQEFNFEMFHRPGTQMQHVDALSRNPVATVSNSLSMSNDTPNMVMTITEGDWLLAVQLQDASICSIREILESGQAELNKDIFNNYELLGNKVYRQTEYGRRWVVPKRCIWQVIRANHDEIGHFAVDKTVERIRSVYWFHRLKRTVSKYIKNCLHCIYYKNMHGKKPGKLYSIPKYARPFHTLHLDHLGPFVKTTQKNTHLLVVVDSFTKFVYILPVKNTKSKIVVNELDKIFKIFGNPRRLVCDAGSAFTSKLFTTYCKDRAIRLHIVATAVPRSNGQVERYNLTILESLRTMGANTDNNKWDQKISTIQQGINSTINKTTLAVPSEVFFGYRLRMDHEQPTEEDDEEKSIDMTALRKKVDERIKENARKQKIAFDSKRKEAPMYNVGDLVVIKVPSYNNDGQSTKLLPQFKGPFQVKECLGNDRYKVEDMRGAERSAKRYNGVACVENMKPWVKIGEEDEE